MKELQLTILKKEDLKNRYERLKGTKIARLTDKAVADGYSIAILNYSGLGQDFVNEWLRYAENAVAAHFKGHRHKIGIFTDLSEIKNDKLYFAFKTKKDFQIAHSISACDSEGFKYNY